MNRPMMFITIAVLSLAAVGLGGGWWPVEASPPEAPSPAAAEPAGASGPDRVVEASPAEIEAQVQHAEAAVPHEDEADDTAQSVRKDAPGALVMADAPPPDQTQGGAIRPGDEVQPRAPILDAASTRVSFQAVLTDNVGNALAGPVNLRFQVYTSPGGVAVGAAIDLLGVPVTNGVVDTQIPIPTSSFDGTGRELGVTVNPPAAELTPRMPITAVPYAYRVDRVASAELDDSIDLGTTAVNGLLNLYRTAANTPGITLTGGASQISTFGSDGLEQIRLWGPSWGEILLMDSSALTNDRTVLLSAGNNTGGSLTLYDPSAAIRATFTAPASGANCILYDGAGSSSVSLRGDLGGRIDAEGSFRVVDSIGGTEHGRLVSETFGGRLHTFDETGLNTSLLGSSTAAGGLLYLYQANGTTLGMNVDGDATGSGGGGLLSVYQSDGDAGVTLDGQSTGAAGEISVFDTDGTETVQILGADSSTQGAALTLRRANGSSTIVMNAEEGDGRGADISLYNSLGVVTINLDADYLSADEGRITTGVLQITGGSDLSEQFDIRATDGGQAQPGMVVCIDADHPGQLKVSDRAYDRKVAGVISGAGGVRTGMLMAQRGTAANGQHPVALTGRVYCLVDAEFGAIEPGDLLTTSTTPGHAMKVTDHAAAQGAIIGKAMSGLKAGRGLVLVLVNLQ